MSLIWYLVPRRANPTTGEWEPDTTSVDNYALAVGTDYYLLTNDVLTDPVLTDGQVLAAGLNPNRKIGGN